MPLVLSRPGVARVEVEMQYEAGRSWREDAARILETGARFVLLAVIGLRPLISESYDLAGMTMTRVLEGVADSLPLHTLLIDLAILGSVLAWALAHGLAGRRRYRWCGLEIGLAMVVIAAVISSLWASNQRVAINASVDWISTAGLSVVLVQLLRDSRHLRLTLCVIVASGAAQAYYCFDQVFVGFEETEQVYREHREAFWEAQGVSLDAPQVELFESRLEAREASGYLSHSNIAAAHLLVAWFAMLAVLAGGWGVGRRTGEGYAGLLVGGLGALGLGWAMVLTHGLGALLAGGVGLALWAARRLARRWIDPRPGRALSFVGAMVVGGSVAVIAYGVR
ncbi:MAG: hypothetical protein GY842_16630, partial [bacterium]|nr:hypothetical protein [bacterium]